MNQQYMRSYVERLRAEHGSAFVEQLYQYLKGEHYLEEAQLPPDPRRTIQLRPEQDIRSRLPQYRRHR